MRVTTRAVYASIDAFINNLPPTRWEGFNHDGLVAELKKGREALDAASRAGQDVTKTGQELTSQGRDIANSEINTQGGLSPLVAKQLANEQGMIGKTYADASRAADRGLSMRGMGVAPSGLTASIRNTGINNAGQAQTGAVGNAWGLQNVLNNSALAQPINALNATEGGVNATTNAGLARNKAGSKLGDIGSFLSAEAQNAAKMAAAGG